MFNLETAITGWRQTMRAAGLQSSTSLEELESHLREEIEHQTRAGLGEAEAFQAAVRQTGAAEALGMEFAKTSETPGEKLKQLFCRFAGMPDYQLAAGLKNSSPTYEPGWVSYLKTLALMLPALCLWVGACVLVLPKLKELCAVSHLELPGTVVTALRVSNLLKNYFIVETVLVFAVLLLLEWRSQRWPHYRRLVFGVAAYGLNFIVLILLAVVCAVAVAAGVHLLPAK